MKFEKREFESNNNDASKIGGQNDRWIKLQEEPDFNPKVGDSLRPAVSEIRRAAEAGIKSEQADVLRHLSEQDYTVYEELANEYNLLQERLQVKTTELEELEAKIGDSEESIRLRSIADTAIQYSPTASAEIEGVVSINQELIMALQRARIEAEITAIEEKLSTLNDVFEEAAKAWPVPLVPREESSESVLIQDTFPVEPTEVNRMVSDAIIERDGKTHGASALIASILVNNAGRVFLPQELVSFVYGVDVTSLSDADPKTIVGYNGRIHRLLNKHDSIVPEILERASEDRFDGQYVLQYGWRYFRDAVTKKPTQRPRMVYRVIFLEDGMSEELEEFTEIVDNHSEFCPPVIPRAMRGLERKPKEQLSSKEAIEFSQGEVPIDSIDALDEKLLYDIKAVIEILEINGLLPEEYTAEMTVGVFKTKLFRVFKNGINSRNPFVKSLWGLTNVADRQMLMNVTSIVMAALSAEYLTKKQCSSNKEYKRRVAIIVYALISYYEQKAPTGAE